MPVIQAQTLTQTPTPTATPTEVPSAVISLSPLKYLLLGLSLWPVSSWRNRKTNNKHAHN